MYSTGRQLLRTQPRTVRYIIFRLQASYSSATSHTGRQPCRVKSLYMKRFWYSVTDCTVSQCVQNHSVYAPNSFAICKIYNWKFTFRQRFLPCRCRCILCVFGVGRVSGIAKLGLWHRQVVSAPCLLEKKPKIPLFEWRRAWPTRWSCRTTARWFRPWPPATHSSRSTGSSPATPWTSSYSSPSSGWVLIRVVYGNNVSFCFIRSLKRLKQKEIQYIRQKDKYTLYVIGKCHGNRFHSFSSKFGFLPGSLSICFQKILWARPRWGIEGRSFNWKIHTRIHNTVSIPTLGKQECPPFPPPPSPQVGTAMSPNLLCSAGAAGVDTVRS